MVKQNPTHYSFASHLTSLRVICMLDHQLITRHHTLVQLTLQFIRSRLLSHLIADKALLFFSTVIFFFFRQKSRFVPNSTTQHIIMLSHMGHKCLPHYLPIILHHKPTISSLPHSTLLYVKISYQMFRYSFINLRIVIS